MNESHDTRTALLASARKLFAQSGYRGTSIKAITTDANANLGAVTYHYGTKEHLYHEVLRSLMGPLLERMRKATDIPAAPLVRLEAGLRTYFSYMHAHSELPSLMLHELSMSGQLPLPIRETVTALLGIISGLIRSGQEEGEVIDGDPILLAISTVAQPLVFLLLRRPLKEVAHINTHEPDTQERVLRHIMAFAGRGLARHGRPRQ